MTSAAPAPDHYVVQFLFLGLPVLVFMLVLGVLSVRRRWKPVAIILGAVFLLTAGSLLKAAGHRQEKQDRLIVQGSGLGCGLAGLLLILLAVRARPDPAGSPRSRDPGPV